MSGTLDIPREEHHLPSLVPGGIQPKHCLEVCCLAPSCAVQKMPLRLSAVLGTWDELILALPLWVHSLGQDRGEQPSHTRDGRGLVWGRGAQ